MVTAARSLGGNARSATKNKKTNKQTNKKPTNKQT
jgi:hypothetical protein